MSSVNEAVPPKWGIWDELGEDWISAKPKSSPPQPSATGTDDLCNRRIHTPPRPPVAEYDKISPLPVQLFVASI